MRNAPRVVGTRPRSDSAARSPAVDACAGSRQRCAMSSTAAGSAGAAATRGRPHAVRLRSARRHSAAAALTRSAGAARAPRRQLGGAAHHLRAVRALRHAAPRRRGRHRPVPSAFASAATRPATARCVAGARRGAAASLAAARSCAAALRSRRLRVAAACGTDALPLPTRSEAREAGVAGRARCRMLFLGDSITEAFRGTQFGETYDELKPRRKARAPPLR